MSGRRTSPLAVRLFQLWLRLYPAAFHHEFADEMAAVFTEALDEAAQAGPGPAAAFIWREAIHAPALLARVHWHYAMARPAPAGGAYGKAVMTTRTWFSTFGAASGLLLLLWLAFRLWPNGPMPLVLLPLAAGSVALLTARLLTPGAWTRASAPLSLAGVALTAGLLALLAATQDESVASLIGAIGLAAGALWQARDWRGRARVLARAALLAILILAPLWWLVTPRAAVAAMSPGQAQLYKLAVNLLWPALATLFSIWLVYLALSRAQPRRPLTRVAYGAAGLLLPAMLAWQIHDYQVWDLATDGLYAWFTVLLSIAPGACAAFLLLAREAHSRSGTALALLLALAVPFAMHQIMLAGLGGRDNHQRTEARAAAVAAAVQAYYDRHGRYPASLADLPPWYIWRPYEPVIFANSGWCYEGGADYFRLGYVYRPGFGSPASRFRVRVYAAAGTPPQADWSCEAEAAALRAQRGP